MEIGRVMVSCFLLAFMTFEDNSCAEEECCPAAGVLIGASATLELLPLILPLAVYRTEKGKGVQSDRDVGNRENRRRENTFKRIHPATSEALENRLWQSENQ